MTPGPSPRAFDPATLALLDSAIEVDIETAAGEAGARRRTIIWVVVVDDQVLVRSVRGTRGRWYRDLQAAPEGMLHVEGRTFAFIVVAAVDKESVDRCSRALARKYAADPALRSMLRPDVLGTTLRLVPA